MIQTDSRAEANRQITEQETDRQWSRMRQTYNRAEGDRYTKEQKETDRRRQTGSRAEGDGNTTAQKDPDRRQRGRRQTTIAQKDPDRQL